MSPTPNDLMNSPRSVALVLTFVGTVLVSCARNEGTSPGGSAAEDTSSGEPAPGGGVARVIGQRGGKLVSSDGKVTLDIPQGALAQDTSISITPVSVERPQGGVSFVGKVRYDFQPDGLRFEKPASLTIDFDTGSTTSTASRLAIYTGSSTSPAWHRVAGNTVDVDAGRATAPLLHFSSYGLGVFGGFYFNRFAGFSKTKLDGSGGLARLIDDCRAGLVQYDPAVLLKLNFAPENQFQVPPEQAQFTTVCSADDIYNSVPLPVGTMDGREEEEFWTMGGMDGSGTSCAGVGSVMGDIGVYGPFSFIRGPGDMPSNSAQLLIQREVVVKTNGYYCNEAGDCHNPSIAVCAVPRRTACCWVR